MACQIPLEKKKKEGDEIYVHIYIQQIQFPKTREEKKTTTTENLNQKLHHKTFSAKGPKERDSKKQQQLK